jgi:hypothetical protein
MAPSKRVAASSIWYRLLEEIISMVAIKVAETSEAPLEDLRRLRLCNKAMERASSSHAIANRFNLKHHYHYTIWGDGDTRVAYLQIVEWLVGANNGEALFIKSMGDICTA